ncbi:hypothetical protein C4588_02935 [Candidatus Parcubacteria bacterium]|nr:MAG: hypothetical protein C4588_02935 [Candidatus Parcubacteria bacterium]
MSHYNHKGRPGKVGGSLPSNNLTRLFFILKGGAGSGNFNHGGIPGHQGGSTPESRSSLGPFEYIGILDKDIQNKIVEYSFRGYKTLNKKLRKGEALDDGEQNIVNSINSALAEAPPIKPSKVYRAIQASPEEIGMEVGKIYTEKAFLSTSSDASYMYKLSGSNDLKTRITIKVPKGTPGLQIEKISKKPKEKEILFNRGTKMKITKIEKDDFDNTNVLAELVE